MEPVELRGWQRDEEYFPFPEGTRDKYALIAPADPADPRIVPGHRYLMKFSNPRYDIQFWSEIIAKALGSCVGVRVPECFYAEDVGTGAPGSLISWFYGEQIERDDGFPGSVDHSSSDDDDGIVSETPSTHSLYVPGSSYMVRHIDNYDLKTGKQHNLKHLGLLVTKFRQSYKQDFWPHWAKLLTFDALIGNTDRHQDNWGVLWRSDPSGRRYPRFAPAFDNGTSLLHEIMEERINKFKDRDFAERYVRRGRHHLRKEIHDERQAGHIDLIEHLLIQRPDLTTTVAECASFDIETLRAELEDFSSLPCANPLTEDRAQAILSVISIRQEMIEKLVQGLT